MIWLWYVLATLVAVMLLYWTIIVTEGTYLGTRAVVLMYDWTARRYNSIKKVRPVYEMYFLGAPLSERLPARGPRVLDVATGTGRLPATLLDGAQYPGIVIGVDHSLAMLEEAVTALGSFDGQAVFVQGDAHRLMFEDNTFDAVSCLEALEFMRDPRAVVREMMRVLKPGGSMLVTNRIGWEAWLFPGRYCRRGKLEALLGNLGMQDIDTHRWQVYYDLIWSVKPESGQTEDERKVNEA